MTGALPPGGGYQPKSKAGKIALLVFIAAVLIVLLVVVIVKN